MPIITQKTVSYVFANLTVDAEEHVITANTRMWVDGKDMGLIQIVIQGEDFMKLALDKPVAGLTRTDDIVNAIYEYAISHGIIEGEIS